MNEAELRNMMFSATKFNGPFTIRYPRGQGVMPDWKTKMEQIQIGTGRELKKGKDIAILSIGHIGNEAVKAVESLEKEGLDPGLYDMRFVKPLDEKLLTKIFKKLQTQL